jgi:hypothetical protein
MKSLRWWRSSTLTTGQTAGPGRFSVGLFLLLNLADWCGTRWLVGDGDRVVEANPLAAGLLARFGWWGMAGYKLACVAVVLALVHVIGCYRPAAARRLWRTGCALMLVLVGYQLGLALAQPWDEEGLRMLAEASRQSAELEKQGRDRQEFRQRLDERAAELAAGRVSLTAALATLEADLQGRSGDLLAGLAIRFPDWDRRAHLALRLLECVADRPGVPESCTRLLGEFETLCGRPVPPSLLDAWRPTLPPQAALLDAGKNSAVVSSFPPPGRKVL